MICPRPQISELLILITRPRFSEPQELDLSTLDTPLLGLHFLDLSEPQDSGSLLTGSSEPQVWSHVLPGPWIPGTRKL